MKAKIEIIYDNKVISEGEKISPSQASLLEKLKLRPFEYKMSVKRVMMDGNMYDPAVLTINEDDVLGFFSKGVSNMTALSLGSGFVTASAAPHLIMHSFKNLAAISFATDFMFPQAAALKAAAAAGASAAGPAKAAESKKEEKAAEAEPEEDSDADVEGAFDLFGGDDY